MVIESLLLQRTKKPAAMSARFAARFARAAAAARPFARAAALGVGVAAITAGPASCSGSWLSWIGLGSSATDYDAVAQSIADLLESNPDYDDGSYGPLFVRLAWHAAGTYSVRALLGARSRPTPPPQPFDC
jgi:cytochrome c peroxidase